MLTGVKTGTARTVNLFTLHALRSHRYLIPDMSVCSINRLSKFGNISHGFLSIVPLYLYSVRCFTVFVLGTASKFKKYRSGTTPETIISSICLKLRIMPR